MRILGRHDDRDGRSPSDADARQPLFHHEVRYGGRIVVMMDAVTTPEGVVVETDVFAVDSPPDAPAERRPFTFTTPEQARRFAEDALVSLEYLDCTVT